MGSAARKAGTEFVQPAKELPNASLQVMGACMHMRLKSLGLAELGQAARSRTSMQTLNYKP